MSFVGYRSVALALVVTTGLAVAACSSDTEEPGGVTPAPTTPEGGGPPVPEASTPDTSPPPDGGKPDSGCEEDVFTLSECTAMKTFGPLPAVPADPTNAYADSAAAATLGQQLFYDKAFSGAIVTGDDGTNGGLGAAGETKKVACVSCHSSSATDDNRSTPNNVSLGTSYGPRNALPLVNSSFYTWTNWGGRFDSQWSLPTAVVENPALMNGTRLEVAHLLFAKYRTEYDAIFPVDLDADLDPASANAARFPATGKPMPAGGTPGAWEAMEEADRVIVNRILANYGKALAAYVRKIVSRNAPFDKYVAGDRAAIDASAKRGLKVFLGKGQCTSCHSGPAFTDNQFHNIGLPQTGAHVPATDLGRFADITPLLASAFNSNGAYSDDKNTKRLDGLVANDAVKGAFRTKSLRNLTSSAPFMHAGQHTTLEQVVAYYVTGGGTPAAGEGTKDAKMAALALSAAEQADLVAFLKTLGGEALPAALLTDTAKP